MKRLLAPLFAVAAFCCPGANASAAELVVTPKLKLLSYNLSAGERECITPAAENGLFVAIVPQSYSCDLEKGMRPGVFERDNAKAWPYYPTGHKPEDCALGRAVTLDLNGVALETNKLKGGITPNGSSDAGAIALFPNYFSKHRDPTFPAGHYELVAPTEVLHAQVFANRRGRNQQASGDKTRSAKIVCQKLTLDLGDVTPEEAAGATS